MTQNRTFQRILILGGTGFIGSALLQQLQAQTTKITCLIHQRSLLTRLTGIQTLYGSITDFNWDNLSIESPNVIYHLARIPGRGKIGRFLAARQSAKVNQRLLDWIAQQPVPPLLVYIAGTLAYGSHGDKFITEDTPLNPTSYAKEYSKGEQPIVDALTDKNIPVMILRPAWVYGLGSWFKQFFLDPIQHFQYIPIYGTGRNWMSFIHVEDCARMIRFLSEHASSDETYNLFSGPPIQQKTFVNVLSELNPGIPIKKMGYFKIIRKYGRAPIAAFNFSLKVDTKHKSLYQNYQFVYPNLRTGLQSILERFHNI